MHKNLNKNKKLTGYILLHPAVFCKQAERIAFITAERIAFS